MLILTWKLPYTQFMSSLTEISVTTRKLAIWLGIGLIVYVVFKSLFSLGISYWKATHKPPPVLPNVLFGKLPAPVFPKGATSSAGFKFILENIEGQPPETTPSGKVYVMPKKAPTILSSQRAKAFATKLGFVSEPEVLSATYYRFTNALDKLLTLEVDIITMNFKFKYDYTKNPQIFFQGTIKSKEQAINEVKGYIGNNGLFDSVTATGKVTADILKFDVPTKTFSPASSLSNTDAVRINFFRNDLDGLKILPPLFDKSYNYVLYTASNSNSWKFPEVLYTYWPIDSTNFAIYPLRSGTAAWQNLIDGQATIVSLGKNSPNVVIIRNIYLAYYDSEDPQIYLQPIFVFEGDNNFVAYLPAVDSQWLE